MAFAAGIGREGRLQPCATMCNHMQPHATICNHMQRLQPSATTGGPVTKYIESTHIIIPSRRAERAGGTHVAAPRQGRQGVPTRGAFGARGLCALAVGPGVGWRIQATFPTGPKNKLQWHDGYVVACCEQRPEEGAVAVHYFLGAILDVSNDI